MLRPEPVFGPGRFFICLRLYTGRDYQSEDENGAYCIMAQRIMKMRTDYDVSHLEELQRVVARSMKREKKDLKSRLLNFLWAAVSLGVAALIYVQQLSAAGAVFCGLLGIFFLLRGIFFYRALAMMARRSMDKMVTGNYYALEKTVIQVMNEKLTSRYAYTECDRLLETENCLYFFMKNGQGLILDKRTLKGGTEEELRDWMEQKCEKPIEWMGAKPRQA